MVPRGKVGNSQHFPTNLHILLDEAEKGNYSHIVFWCCQGTAFKIYDQDALVPLLAKYFRQTKFKSFLRQLQSYDFHRTTRGCDKGVVSHPLFIRGRRSLCFRMSRKPTGAAAAASQSTLSRGNASFGTMAFSQSIVPSNGIMPIRKVFSNPNIGNSSEPVGLQRNQDYTDMSKLKNATFELQGQPLAPAPNNTRFLDSYVIRKASSSPEIMNLRGHHTNNIARSSNNASYDVSQTRSLSAPTVMNTQQQQNTLECAEIDYSLNTSTSSVDTRTPQESLTYTDAQHIPPQQQFIVQTHPRQQHIQQSQNYVPHHVLQHNVQVCPVQQLIQNHVEVLHVQYQRGSESQNQAQHQTIREEQENEQAKQQYEPQEQVQFQEVKQVSQPPTKLLYIQRNICDQIKELRENMVKQLKRGCHGDYHPVGKLETDSQFHNTGFQGHNQSSHSLQEQVESGLQQQEKCLSQGQQQTDMSQPQLNQHQPFQSVYHPVQPEPVVPAVTINDRFLKVPCVTSCSSMNIYQPSPKPIKKSTASSNDVDFSFSTTEFQIGYGNKGDSSNGSSLNTHSNFPSHEVVATSGAPSFSTVVSMGTNQTGGMPSSNVFASTASTSSDNTGGYKTTLHLTTRTLDTQQKIRPTVTTSFSQHQEGQHQQRIESSAPLETASNNDIEVGTVDYLIRQNDMGLDDWEMKPEDIFGLFNATTETADCAIPAPCLSHQQMHSSLPCSKSLAVTTMMAPSKMQ
mmetsp:Transcript_23614/g.65524  ORF Transcript_23614/g.65524 Transcript_23614/m.65524 type:complete len:738 (+) Transcript_23614:237-2450(+)